MADQHLHESTKTKPNNIRGAILATAAALGVGGVGGYFAHQTPLPPPAPEVYFSPEGGCTAAILRVIKGAETDIRVQAYAFDSLTIADSLIEAHRRGRTVRVLMDKSCRSNPSNLARYLRQAGIPVRVDDQHSIAHSKVVIIDRRLVVTGSFNFTEAAERRNAENLLIIRHPDTCARYQQSWDEHWSHSRAFQEDSVDPDRRVITPEETSNHVGKVCTVEMTVVSVGSYNGKVFLNSRANYKDPGNFTIVLYPTANPERINTWSLEGKKVQVTGRISLYEQRREIEVRDIAQLRHVPIRE